MSHLQANPTRPLILTRGFRRLPWQVEPEPLGEARPEPWIEARLGLWSWVSSARLRLGRRDRGEAALTVWYHPADAQPLVVEGLPGCAVEPGALPAPEGVHTVRLAIEGGSLVGWLDGSERLRCPGAPEGDLWWALDGGDGEPALGALEIGTRGEAGTVLFEAEGAGGVRPGRAFGWLLGLGLLPLLDLAVWRWRHGRPGLAGGGRIGWLWLSYLPLLIIGVALRGPWPGVWSALVLAGLAVLVLRGVVFGPELWPARWLPGAPRWWALGWALCGLALDATPGEAGWSAWEGSLTWFRWRRPGSLLDPLLGALLMGLAGLLLAEGLPRLWRRWHGMEEAAAQRHARWLLLLGLVPAAWLAVQAWLHGIVYYGVALTLLPLCAMAALHLRRIQFEPRLRRVELTAAASLLLLVLGLELACRASPLDYRFLRWRDSAGEGLAVWNPDNPGDRPGHVFFGRDGVRGLDEVGNGEFVPIARTPGRRRLLTLGTSSTDGWGATWPHLWPNLLADELDMELANAASGGATTPQLMLQYHHLGRRLSPDVVLVYIGANDGTYRSTRPLRPDLVAHGLHLPEDPLAGGGAVNPASFGVWLGRVRLFSLYRDWLLGATGQSTRSLVCPPDDFEFYYRWLAERCAEDGCEVVLVSELLRGGQQVGWADAILRRIAAEHDHVRYLDSRRWALGADDYIDYVHFSPSGHSQVAAALAEALR